jgi:hypothetical protein
MFPRNKIAIKQKQLLMHLLSVFQARKGPYSPRPSLTLQEVCIHGMVPSWPYPTCHPIQSKSGGIFYDLLLQYCWGRDGFLILSFQLRSLGNSPRGRWMSGEAPGDRNSDMGKTRATEDLGCIATELGG